MRRDMDLIKTIMLKIENNDLANDIDGYSMQEVLFHKKMLIDAGFLVGKSRMSLESSLFEVSAVFISGITWEGYNFIDIIKDDNKFKILKDLGKNLSMEAFKTVFNQVIQNMMT
jgi:hypothetical protein